MLSCPKLAACNDIEESYIEEDEDSEVNNGLSLRDSMSIVWGSRLRFTTTVVCFSCFVANFLYYGGVYSFPQILPSLGFAVLPAFSLFLGAVFGLVGSLVTLWTMHTFNRKRN